MPYVRTVKTSSGATAVQIVYSSHRGSREIEHLGSAHSGAEVELLKAVARQRLAAGQGELDLGLAVGAPGGQRDSIEAHLTVVFAALAISRWTEAQTGWSIRKFRPHRPPLPGHRDPGRRPHHHRSRPLPDDLTSTAATPQATETIMLAGSRAVPGDFHGQSAML